MRIEIFSFCVAVVLVSYMNQDFIEQNVCIPTIPFFRLGMKPNYEIGLGRADITGPAADVNMVRYK